MCAGGTPPDVMMMAGPETFAEKGVLLPLNEFLGKEPEVKERFLPQALEDSTFKGKVYQLPREANTTVLYYNQDLFDKEGLAYPDENWTWDDLLSGAKKLTKDIDNDGRINQYGYLMWVGKNAFPSVFVRQGEGEIVDKQGNFVLDSSEDLPRSIKGIQFAKDLVIKYKVSPNPGQQAEMWGEAIFQSQRVAMFPCGPWCPLKFANNIKDKFRWNVAMMPKGPAGRKLSLVCVGYAISKDTKHPKESWEFIKFLTSKEIMEDFGYNGRSAPAVKEALYSDKYLGDPIFKGINKQAIVKSVEEAEARHILKKPAVWEEISNTMAQNWERIVLEMISPEEGLKNIYKKAKEILGE